MDFEPLEAKPAAMQFPVSDAFAAPIPIAPFTAMIFTAVFASVALVTLRRPAFGLATLVAVQPFALYRELFDTTITLPKVALLGLVVGLAAFHLRPPPQSERAWQVIAATLALLVAATAFSALHAQHPAASLRETLKYFEYAALAVAAFIAYRLDPDDALLVGAVALSATLVSLTALVQIVAGAPSVLHVGSALVPRIAGALEGPNQLAAYLESAIAILAAWTIARPSRVTAAVLALCAGVAVLTLSRAGLAGVAIVAIVVAALRGRAAWRALAPMCAGLLTGATIAGALAHSLAVFRFSTAPSDYAGGVGTRDELWRAAWTLWQRHELFGVGAGNFELELDQAGVFGVRTHANSWYLQSLVEGGPLLLAATIACIAALCAGLWRGARDASPWALAALAATIALSAHQIVDYVFFFPKVAGPWWILVGIGLAAAYPLQEATAACAPSR